MDYVTPRSHSIFVSLCAFDEIYAYGAFGFEQSPHPKHTVELEVENGVLIGGRPL